ncbi:MAG: hypothetical protein Q8P52_02065 [bacterium]|nr:hypothetical protein [bacterium]
MKFNTLVKNIFFSFLYFSEITIPAITLLLGFFFKQLFLWIPLSVLIAGFIDLFTRQWVMSDRVGEMQRFSMTLKSAFALIGFYAMIGQVICVGLIIWWFIFQHITTIIVTIIILGVLCYVVISRNGNLSFWKKAAKNPDFVYEQFSQDDAWVIDDRTNHVDKTGFAGPFLLYVPSIGKTIKFYGKIDKYEESQNRIEKELLK